MSGLKTDGDGNRVASLASADADVAPPSPHHVPGRSTNGRNDPYELRRFMSDHRSLFSERSQRAIMWWGIGLAIVYIAAFIFLLQQVPLKNPTWSAEQVADFYLHNQGKIKW